MNTNAQTLIYQATFAERITARQRIQSLWSGYGELFRLHLHAGNVASVVIKHVYPPTALANDFAHQRKLHSYQVELNWYRDWSKRCGNSCRVPRCLGAQTDDNESLLILEDLDVSGFSPRKHRLTKSDLTRCLHWLANFHATFMQEAPVGLWPTGSYWHLATRPAELTALQQPTLKRAAHEFDRRLNSCRHQTLIHGDAKVDNFCFHRDEEQVAAVDFQYVGGGCGMKDVAYLFDSALTSQQCEAWEEDLLNDYFATLRHALDQQNKDIDWLALETEWRTLYPIAWADFYRFLLGWAPGVYAINAYAQRMIDLAITDHGQVQGA